MRLALAQINTVVGDLAGNRARILERLSEARDAGADLVLFPELAVTGYPPEDLLLRPASARGRSSRSSRSRASAAGSPRSSARPTSTATSTTPARSASAAKCAALYRKRFLPNYGVFDEARYFAPGRDLLLLEHGDALLGPTICEDIWQPGPPATELSLAGAQLVDEHLRVAVPRRQAARARGDAEDPRARQRLLHRVLQRGRRPGRADLRRPLGRARRRRRGDRPRAGLRGVPAGRRRRPGGRGRHGGCATSAGGRSAPRSTRRRAGRPHRRAARRAGAVPSPRRRAARGRARADAARARARARATTCARTASPTSSSASRAASTRRSPRRSRSRRSAPEHVHCVSMPSRYCSPETQSRRAAAGREPRRSTSSSCRSSTSSSAFEATLAPVFAGREPDLTEENIQARVARRRCSWRCRTSSAGCSSRPATSRSSRSATRRSTATWPAASRC